MKIGIIGAGRMAQAVGLLATKVGHQVMLSNSRGPETIRHIGQQIGCEVGTVDDVAAFGDMIVAAIHLQMSAAIPAAPLKGKVVLKPQNYFPHFWDCVWMPPVMQEVFEGIDMRSVAVVCQASGMQLFTRRGPVWFVRGSGSNRLRGL